MRALMIFGLALVLTGCGSLHIEVSVLDPRTVEHEADRLALRDELATVLGQDEGEARQPIIEVQREHFEFLSQLKERYQKSAESTTDPLEREVLQAQVTSVDQSLATFRPKYVEAQQLMQDVQRKVSSLNQKLEQSSGEESARLQAEIANLLRIRRGRLISLRKAVEDEIGDQIRAAPSDMPPQVLANGQQAIRTARRSLIAGQGLVDDPFAHTVAAAPEELWAPSFNRVFGRGWFGNLNMAVKMEDLGDFTLKGLTFDPSDVARVAGKVTTQALLLASQIAGVPVSTTVNQSGTTSTSGGALAASSKKIAETERATAMQRAKVESYQDGLVALAGTVLREWTSLENDKQRAAGISAIKGSFAANQSRLKMEGFGTSTTSGAVNNGTASDDQDQNSDDNGGGGDAENDNDDQSESPPSSESGADHSGVCH